MSNGKFISIVIPTRNAGNVLETSLMSIRSHFHRDMEIIVVDNYSSDETREVARRYGANVIIAGPPPPHNDFFTAPIQRRVGATHASGEYLFFIDADMILSDGLIEELRSAFRGVDAVVVPEISFGSGFWTRCKVLERSCYLGDEAIEAPRFIKRLVFERVGGWRDEVGGFDDWDLNLRLRGHGFKVIRSKHRIFHNEGRLTMRRFFMKKYQMGKVINPLRYSSQHKKSSKMWILQLTPLRLTTLLRRIVRLAADPVEVFGVMLMKLIEGTALMMGFAFSKMVENKSNVST